MPDDVGTSQIGSRVAARCLLPTPTAGDCLLPTPTYYSPCRVRLPTGLGITTILTTTSIYFTAASQIPKMGQWTFIQIFYLCSLLMGLINIAVAVVGTSLVNVRLPRTRLPPASRLERTHPSCLAPRTHTPLPARAFSLTHAHIRTLRPSLSNPPSLSRLCASLGIHRWNGTYTFHSP